MKFLATLGLLAASFFIPVAAQASTIQQISQASYELFGNGLGYCSGQFVSPTRYVTAAHCYEEGVSYSVKTTNNNSVQEYKLKLHKINKVLDTVSFDVVDPDVAFPFVDVAEKYIADPGDSILMASFPLVRDDLLIESGILSNIVETPLGLADGSGDGYSYLAVLETAPGSSGGGLYTWIDGTWKLIGTVQGGPPQHDFFSYFSVLAGIRNVTE